MRLIFIIFLLIPHLSFAKDFQVFSWNVFMLPKPIKFSLQPERTKLITSEIIKVDSDIVLLQEAFSASFRLSLGKQLKEKYPHQMRLGKSTRLTHFMNSGLLVFSKHPLKKLGHYYFTNCKKADCLASKGVLLLEVEPIKGQKVQVAVTHLQSGKNQIPIRQTQVLEMRALFDKHQQPGVPLILAGDLNIDGLKTEEYPYALKALSMEGAALSGNIKFTNGFPVNCYKVPGEANDGEWLDHLWVKSNNSRIKVEKLEVIPMTGIIKGETCPLSDHYPIKASISL